ncbi:MAG: hypothetical protein GY745_07380 [Actinomycetia bacterium]|nr:hypothetical protein [Actinomycetes bacterium]
MWGLTMTSEDPERAFVWSWLPGTAEPIPTGVLEALPAPAGGFVIAFAYGRSYLANEAAIPLYLPELPLGRGRIEPGPGLDVAGVIRDGGPDAWGQRVIMRPFALDARVHDPGGVPLLSYLLRSGSNRPGALDFQDSPTEHVPRLHDAPIEDLLMAADAIQAGDEVDASVAKALTAGSSVGGARPKATLIDGSRNVIAKFSAPTDTYPVIKAAEGAAMQLARLVGLNVAETEPDHRPPDSSRYGGLGRGHRLALDRHTPKRCRRRGRRSHEPNRRSAGCPRRTLGRSHSPAGGCSRR